MCAFLAPGGAKFALKWANMQEIDMAQTYEVYGVVLNGLGGHLSVLAIFSQ